MQSIKQFLAKFQKKEEVDISKETTYKVESQENTEPNAVQDEAKEANKEQK